MTTCTEHGVPGEWARVRGTMLSLWPLFVALVALGAFGAATVLAEHEAVFGAFFLASAAFAVWAWCSGARRVTSFFVGARGEERVASELRHLPAGYHVFHDFAAGRQVVDHLVIGPTGVFCVETKNWGGRVTVTNALVTVDGHMPSRQPVAQALDEASAVRAALAKVGCGESVTPIVCFARNNFEAAEGRLDSVSILNVKDVLAAVTGAPAGLSPDDVTRIVSLLAR